MDEIKFSQRYGYSPVRTVIQIEEIDDALRNSLWSALQMHYWDTARRGIHGVSYISKGENTDLYILCTRLWLNFLKRALDTMDANWSKVREQLRSLFFSAPWHQVYDFVEFVSLDHPNDEINSRFRDACNHFLEREMSAYRFVAGRLTRIVEQHEIASIEEASRVSIDPVREHIRRALELMSDRRSPDYRNSIKESISAVESLALSVLGKSSGTLGELLAQVEKAASLHPALKDAFVKLYGYTSNADGIRHALLQESSLRFEDAKFMLTACSAFINYVLDKTKDK